MDTATVWMCSLSDCGQESLLDRLPALLDAASAARGARWSGALAAVKVAAGELGNTTGYLDVAARNGFCAETLGAPLIIADGLRGGWEASLELGLPEMERVEVAGALAEVDGLVVLTHFKGHQMSGTGGAIKQLGMGCLGRRGKSRVHRANSPRLNAALCTACHECLESCPYGALRPPAGGTGVPVHEVDDAAATGRDTPSGNWPFTARAASASPRPPPTSRPPWPSSGTA